MTWTHDQARALAQKILAMSKAPACEISLSLRTLGHTRFAANDVTTAGMSDNLSITITSIDGGRSGTITADTIEDSGLRDAVARSEALLATARPNPEAVEPLGPQDYPAIAAFDAATADASPIVRSKGVEARARSSARPRAGRIGLLRDRGGLVGDREFEGEFRFSPLNLGRLFRDDAHRGRHGLGLRRDRRPAAVRH